MSYSQALHELGTRFTRPKMRALCKTLGRIDEMAEAAGEPELAVLVVREGDGLPGQGWWVGRSAMGYDGSWTGPEAAALVRKLQRKAFRYWKKRQLLARPNGPDPRHCEERSDEAISRLVTLDCFAALAKTLGRYAQPCSANSASNRP